MRFARFVLAVCALPFAVIGFGFLLLPVDMASLIGVRLADATAVADVRAVYGGLQLGCAACLALAAANPAWVRAGLVGQLALYGGLAGARVLSYALSGWPSTLGFLLHAGEMLGLAAGIVAWSTLSRAGIDAPPQAESHR